MEYLENMASDKIQGMLTYRRLVNKALTTTKFPGKIRWSLNYINSPCMTNRYKIEAEVSNRLPPMGEHITWKDIGLISEPVYWETTWAGQPRMSNNGTGWRFGSKTIRLRQTNVHSGKPWKWI